MNENLFSDHGWVLFPSSFFRLEFVMSLGHGCLGDMAQGWNADEALVLAGSLPLALTDWLFLSNSSSEEARCFSCRLEQEVFQEFALLMSWVCSSWVFILQGKNKVKFEICVAVCKFSCCTVSILRNLFNSLANQPQFLMCPVMVCWQSVSW